MNVRPASYVRARHRPGLAADRGAQLDAFLQQFVKRSCPVIPVILPGVGELPELPSFLDLMHRVDFRQDDPDPVDQLIWGITGKKPWNSG